VGADFLCLFLCHFFCNFLGPLYHTRDRHGRRAKGSFLRVVFARTADGKRTAVLAMI